MNELGQLYQEATETSRPPSAQAVTQRIQRRFRRRRAGRFGAGVLAAAALVVGGVAWHGGGTTPPAPIDSATRLPTDHAVGVGEYVQPHFASDGSTPTNATLKTRSGTLYVAPGRIGPTQATLGTPLSPNGRWLVTSIGRQVVVRDLTGRTMYRTKAAGRAGVPVAWSPDGRWLVLRKAPDDNRIDDGLFRMDLHSGTVRQLAIGAHHNAGELAAILPNGNPVFEVPGTRPKPKPTSDRQSTFGSGVYQVVDPTTGTLSSEYTVPYAQWWEAQDVARIDPAAPKHKPHLAWMPGTRSPLIMSPDGSQGATVTTRYTKGATLRLGVVDVRHDTEKYINVNVAPYQGSAPELSAVREWRPITLDHGKLILLGLTGTSAYPVQLTIDLTDGDIAILAKIHYPEGSLPAGVVSIAR